ncbi:hypothetical protein FQV27_00965 [Paracoccus aurantiacus]|uniref:Uncharacterized protein n=1 Tax=Paracoccus aurantiacus TaxID=2599412 RepID=A0A5C6S7Y3_9RHOB|nr:hypothetical protein [Paracoccus aurantiacus]TXB70478.1 hypothetical protein FQV27_00965 [Paracoccus aurantiacus]
MRTALFFLYVVLFIYAPFGALCAVPLLFFFYSMFAGVLFMMGSVVMMIAGYVFAPKVAAWLGVSPDIFL